MNDRQCENDVCGHLLSDHLPWQATGGGMITSSCNRCTGCLRFCGDKPWESAAMEPLTPEEINQRIVESRHALNTRFRLLPADMDSDLAYAELLLIRLETAATQLQHDNANLKRTERETVEEFVRESKRADLLSEGALRYEDALTKIMRHVCDLRTDGPGCGICGCDLTAKAALYPEPDSTTHVCTTECA